MALDSVHPEYQDMTEDWVKVRDVYAGERQVKSKGATYLPPTKGMILDGYGKLAPTKTTIAGATSTSTLGAEEYSAYKLRAVLPEYLQDAVEVFIGLLHSQPPTIKVPAQMDNMLKKTTAQGESAELLLRRINEEQLVAGRLGLLLDLPENPDPSEPLPYISTYIAESCRNWDAGEEGAALSMVVLDESGYEREEFEWKNKVRYRVLMLRRGDEEVDADDLEGAVYVQALFEANEGGTPVFVEADMEPPTLRGQELEQIPFVFVNSKDIAASPDKPPLLQLAEGCLTIYRGEADYRQNLFQQGQDTLVVKGDLKRKTDINELASEGEEEPLRTGVGAMIHLEGGADNDAKYIGVRSEGLSEQRSALENDRKRAEARAGALSTDSSVNGAESGEALKTRVAARTASLNQIAMTGAAALEYLLKAAATWLGANPDEVEVIPNTEFADYQMTGENLARLMAAKQAGAPLSRETIHEIMSDGGLTRKTYDEELEAMEKEAEDEVPEGTDAGGDPEEPPVTED